MGKTQIFRKDGSEIIEGSANGGWYYEYSDDKYTLCGVDEAYYYKTSRASSRDTFYVYATESDNSNNAFLGESLAWGNDKFIERYQYDERYYDLDYFGKINTELAQRDENYVATIDGKKTIWNWLKNEVNGKSHGGCSDWFIGDSTEISNLIYSNLLYHNNQNLLDSLTLFWSSEEGYMYDYEAASCDSAIIASCSSEALPDYTVKKNLNEISGNPIYCAAIRSFGGKRTTFNDGSDTLYDKKSDLISNLCKKIEELVSCGEINFYFDDLSNEESYKIFNENIENLISMAETEIFNATDEQHVTLLYELYQQKFNTICDIYNILSRREDADDLQYSDISKIIESVYECSNFEQIESIQSIIRQDSVEKVKSQALQSLNDFKKLTEQSGKGGKALDDMIGYYIWCINDIASSDADAYIEVLNYVNTCINRVNNDISKLTISIDYGTSENSFTLGVYNGAPTSIPVEYYGPELSNINEKKPVGGMMFFNNLNAFNDCEYFFYSSSSDSAQALSGTILDISSEAKFYSRKGGHSVPASLTTNPDGSGTTFKRRPGDKSIIVNLSDDETLYLQWGEPDQKYYVYAGNNEKFYHSYTVRWSTQYNHGYGYTDNYFGSGKITTDSILESNDNTLLFDDSMWKYIKDLRECSFNECNDWFIGSVSEYDQLLKLKREIITDNLNNGVMALLSSTESIDAGSYYNWTSLWGSLTWHGNFRLTSYGLVYPIRTF